ncbi:hypothetical protein BT96DRAFT_940190 [Gymnopus androsaceus JB14]|uniref:Uncharacterized protein n=1 Tax=Gymnopus androsaceus JB14 TaxID=1447944 RepID=A0A6A4HMW9_9AGAR|nr:hypothetical protein BT96DRAFT_940190 [Gymnopus androsaceus JB14]
MVWMEMSEILEKKIGYQNRTGPVHMLRPSPPTTDSLWVQFSVCDPLIGTMDSNNIPTCTPPVYDSASPNPPVMDNRPFYMVFAGDRPGCYRDWYASSITLGIRIAVRLIATTLISSNGTLYSGPHGVGIPQPVNPPPSQHNVVYLPSTQTAHHRQGSTSTPGSSIKPSQEPSNCDKTGSASHKPVPEARLWAVHTRQFVGVASASKAEKLIASARKQGEDFMASKVVSVVEAQEWFDRLELDSDDSDKE